MKFKALLDSPFFRKIRVIIALIIIAGSALLIGYAVEWDFLWEQREEFELKLPHDDISYLLTLKSFDYLHNEVKALIELKFNPMNYLRHNHEVKYHFGPIGYYDGSLSFKIFGLKNFREIDVFCRMNGITKKRTNGLKKEEPQPITIDLIAIGNPKLYPFDKFILAGGAYCVIMEEFPAGEPLKKFKAKMPFGNGILAKIDIPGFFVRRARFDEVKHFVHDQGNKDTDKIGFEKWNKENIFLLTIYRPLFLRVMTVLLGIFSFFWVSYIVIAADIKNTPINVMAYFIGLWSMREIVSKGTNAFPTLLDYGILCLYSILIVGTFCKLIWPKKSS